MAYAAGSKVVVAGVAILVQDAVLSIDVPFSSKDLALVLVNGPVFVIKGVAGVRRTGAPVHSVEPSKTREFTLEPKWLRIIRLLA